jgi:hypothetical protein
LAALPLAAQSLDFEAYRTRVEPIFLKTREGHTPCVVCHSSNVRAFNLQPLKPETPGIPRISRGGTRERIEAGDAGQTRIERSASAPLAHDGGGDVFHSGGRQFRSKDDAEWKILAEWVRQAKPTAR